MDLYMDIFIWGISPDEKFLKSKVKLRYTFQSVLGVCSESL